MRVALKNKRKAKRLTVAEIAEKLNISASFYYKIEKSIRNPTIELAKQIADILEGTIEELFYNNELDDASKKMPTGTKWS